MLDLWQACREAGRNPTIRNGVVRVLVKHEADKTIVAFPGTGEGASKVGAVVSWLINAVHISTSGRHSGWLAQLVSVYLPLRRELSKDKWRTVVVTGYSQGGALALLLADHLFKNGFTVECHAFAAPRPFRLWYPTQIAGAWYRNGGDIVTRLPPLTMMYKHGAKRVAIGQRRLLPSIKDHYPDEYARAIIAMEG